MKVWHVMVVAVVLLAIGVVIMINRLPEENGDQLGRFEPAEFTLIGQPQRLGDEFAYIDPDGVRWAAPKDMTTDGASIPSFLWQIVGDPFGGRYLYAAIVHDAYCDEDHFKGERPHEDVHRMFYRACLCAGVEPDKAKLLYAGVHYFGPKWDWPYVKPSAPVIESPDPGAPTAPEVVVPAWTVDKRISKELLQTKAWTKRAPGNWKDLELSKLDVEQEVRTGKFRYNLKAVTTDGQVLNMGSEDPQELKQNVEAAQAELMQRCKEWIGKNDPSLEQIENWNFKLPE